MSKDLFARLRALKVYDDAGEQIKSLRELNEEGVA